MANRLTPLELLARLPADQPVFMLHSGASAPPFARYSVIALPDAIYRFTDRSELTVLRRVNQTDAHENFRDIIRAFTHQPLHDLDVILQATQQTSTEPLARPYTRGWIGAFSYELGAVIEPSARRRDGERRATDWPLIEMGWCSSPCVFDNLTGQWIRGADDLKSEISNSPCHESCSRNDDGWHAGALTAAISREAHVESVARTIEHIRAGDIFQANFTQQFTAPFAGNTRAFARAALDASGAWYGAMLELTAGRTIVSMSPELFLHVDAATRRVITRPIKGTRRRDLPPRELEASEKDKAELAMIVDLMRNDLGRVCEIGSISVASPRTIETHGAVHQGVGEVTGTLRRNTSFIDLLRATFPPGSVTGCPKIRAMQIIDELEASPRGPYCGALGVISDAGDITLNVAIRTIVLQGNRPADRFDIIDGTLHYGAGGGIVVDSDPALEYEETLAKTQLLQDLILRVAT